MKILVVCKFYYIYFDCMLCITFASFTRFLNSSSQNRDLKYKMLLHAVKIDVVEFASYVPVSSSCLHRYFCYDPYSFSFKLPIFNLSICVYIHYKYVSKLLSTTKFLSGKILVVFMDFFKLYY